MLSKCVNVAKMSKCICKGLTLAQCIDVKCRPTVEGQRPLHSAYLHTLIMCIYIKHTLMFTYHVYRT